MSNYAAKLSGEIRGVSRAYSVATDHDDDLDGQATEISAAFGVWRLPSGRTSRSQRASDQVREKYQDRQCQPSHTQIHVRARALKVVSATRLPIGD